MEHLANHPRFKLLQDEDAHWFCVPVSLVDGFDDWVANSTYPNKMEAWDGPDYSGYEIDGPHILTFIDPVEE